MIDPLYIGSGFAVGFLVGITGVGGGSLMTPLLILLFGVHPATAVGTDLLYAASTKTMGTLVHAAGRNVDWALVGLLATGSVPATVATIVVLSQVDLQSAFAQHVIALALGTVLVVTAAFLILGRNIRNRYAERLQWLDHQLDTPLRKFVFLHKPPDIGKWGKAFDASPWHENAQRFTELVGQHRVDRVFVGHIHTYGAREIDGVRYVLSGGAGAPLDPSPHAYFHYVLVTVAPDGVQDRVIRLRPL